MSARGDAMKVAFCTTAFRAMKYMMGHADRVKAPTMIKTATFISLLDRMPAYQKKHQLASFTFEVKH